MSYCAAQMATDAEGQSYAISRGLTQNTVQCLGIGWNPSVKWDERSDWGLEPEDNAKLNPKMVWLPAGLIIPSRREVGITAIVMRRTAWMPEDTRPKYVAVAGSVHGLTLGCDSTKPVVIVESEIDAVLIWQEAGDLVGAVALGSAGNKPDTYTTAFLRTVPYIFLALDNDAAGRVACPWWPAHFPNTTLWPPYQGKDVGEMIATPALVRAWIEAATVLKTA